MNTTTSTIVSLELSQHVDMARLSREDGSEQRVISVRRNGSDLGVFKKFLDPSDGITAQLAFGGNRFYKAALEQMPSADWPLLWVQGDVCSGSHVTGMQAFAMPGQPVRRVTVAGRVVGSFWQDADADYCLLAGILPTDFTVSRGAQTTSCLENMDVALQEVGMEFKDIVRTWFYNDHLLDWYGEFNKARTTFFQQRGIFEHLVPASTGIGACNPLGAALMAAALAIKPRHDRVSIREVESPLQCSATEYRSSFSRAVEIGFPDHRLLTISGTASIDPVGNSVHLGDVEEQICLTLKVVGAILESRGMSWSDTTRAIGYFRDFGDLPKFEACCQRFGIPKIPMVPVHATVCRDDLLFELELDAVTTE